MIFRKKIGKEYANLSLIEFEISSVDFSKVVDLLIKFGFISKRHSPNLSEDGRFPVMDKKYNKMLNILDSIAPRGTMFQEKYKILNNETFVRFGFFSE